MLQAVRDQILRDLVRISTFEKFYGDLDVDNIAFILVFKDDVKIFDVY